MSSDLQPRRQRGPRVPPGGGRGLGEDGARAAAAPLPGARIKASPGRAAPSSWLLSSSAAARRQQPGRAARKAAPPGPAAGRAAAGPGPRASLAPQPRGPCTRCGGSRAGPMAAPSSLAHGRAESGSASCGAGGRREENGRLVPQRRRARVPSPPQHGGGHLPRPTMHRATGRRVGQAGPPRASRGCHGYRALSRAWTPGASPERPGSRGCKRRAAPG